MNGNDLRTALGTCLATIEPLTGRDWNVPVPDQTWTAADVAEHIALGNLWYAIDLAAAGVDTPAKLTMKPEATPSDVVTAIRTTTSMLADLIDLAPAERRGYHPFGMADPAGFAAMGCDEVLVPTCDTASALGVTFVADNALAARVLARLCPEVAPEPNPWLALLWANGRLALPERPIRRHWQWKAS